MSHRHVIMQVTALSLIAQVGQTQTPFVDSTFTAVVEDADPDLVIVRERFDSEKNIQSIYIRFHDGTPDYEVVSGRIRFSGATPISLITQGRALKESDASWGVAGVNYGRNRGLDGPDPTTHLPIDDLELVEVEHDLARLEMDEEGLSVRFWFGTRRDVDDMRILIRYPEENQTALMQLVLYHRRGPDTEGYPGTTDGGLQIGNIEEDIAPDDGRYDNEVFSIQGLKLRLEDLDILEDEIELGRIDYRGGAIGPGIMTIDNMFDGSDADDDNGRDQNGVISPVPTSGPLSLLRHQVSPLQGPNNSVIPASGVQVLDLPRSLPAGERSTGQLSVDAPPDLPEGVYTGTIQIWEDNNNDGVIDPEEPQDIVTIVAEVKDEEELPPDAFQPAEAADGGVDPVDSAVASLDLGHSTRFEDAEPRDETLEVDAEVEADEGVMNPSKLEQGVFDDKDAGELDAMVSDIGLTDATIEEADADQRDDEHRAATQQRDDDDRLLAGLPRGGAFQCNIVQASPWSVLLLCLMLSALRRRR
ncbi:MAG: hypothetical protein VX589_02520 [Myxococcota bacterium]|nr:hypothetical protein [Myxococcota bacterium]